jgi:regulator of sigma E protease
MSWLLAFLGFAALIILHELGHFLVAKAVGMRVERFSLFFPPLIWRRQGKGETEYTIGAVPLGGYVKISGMNPHEEIPPEHAHRAYFRQPVWKRIAVIVAGPLVNILLCLLILTVVFLIWGAQGNGTRVGPVQDRYPASGELQVGDVITAVDGRTGRPEDLSKLIASHRCAGKLVNGCRAETPAQLTIERDSRTIQLALRPVYDAKASNGADAAPGRMRLGFVQEPVIEDVGPGRAVSDSAGIMWEVTTLTVSTLSQILFDAEKRKEVSGIVGTYETTRQAVEFDTQLALKVLALISLSLGIINLFPFLPLDGGHIFWALAEKVRRRPIPFSVMERAGFVGMALVAVLFFIGLSNDIDRLAGEGFGIGR